jgi:uncharacterized protein HemX
VGIPENEKVDSLAKDATSNNQKFQLENQPQSLANLQQQIQQTQESANPKQHQINNTTKQNLQQTQSNRKERRVRNISTLIRSLPPQKLLILHQKNRFSTM